MGDKPEFNQASLFVSTLDWITRSIVECLRDGDLLGAYRLTERLFVLIDYKARIKPDSILFEQTYADYLEDIENKLDKIHSSLQDNTKLAKLNSGLIDKEIRDVSRLLYWLQWDLNLIFPKKQMLSFDKEVENDFE